MPASLRRQYFLQCIFKLYIYDFYRTMMHYSAKRGLSPVRPSVCL